MTSTVIGMDIGGTKSAIGRFHAETWELLAYEKLPTRAERGFKAVYDELVEVLKTWCDASTIAIGVGVPGLVRNDDGVLLNAPNIPESRNIPLRAMLGESLGLPVALQNDASCFTLAEARMGAGRDHSVVVGVTLGTGVGGGIVVNGHLFHGSLGFAAELGHMLLTPGSVPFESKDQRGTVEQHISGTAIRKRFPEAEDAAAFFGGANFIGHRETVTKEIAWFCVNLTCVLNPSIIVFGGSVGAALGPVLDDIQKEMTHWALPGMTLPKIAVKELEHPGTTGAALLTTLED